MPGVHLRGEMVLFFAENKIKRNGVNLMIKAYLDQVVAGGNLSQTDAAAAMQVILDGQATEAQIGAFLTRSR